MNYKSIQNRINVKELLTKATDKNYFNLFQPVIPKIDLTGKVAQVISGVTEAVTVWLICQSELSSINKVLSFILSVVAVILVVAAIEIGGRKGLQVLTRAIVWKRLVSFWYWILFLFVLAITGFLFWQSFGLSTKGIDQSFKQSVKTAITFDDSQFLAQHDNFLNRINFKFDNQNKTLSDAFILNFDAKEKQFNSKIEGVNNLIDKHTRNKTNGVKWAQGHIDKQTKNRDKLITEKESKLSELTTSHTNDLKTVEAARLTALNKEDTRYKKAVEKAEKALTDNHTSDKENAQFWGDLFSNLVGFMIVIAFVCIIITEIFHRGAGIEIDYKEAVLPPTLFNIFLEGLNNRTFNVSYKWAKKWYVERKDFDFLEPSKSMRRIGFQLSSDDANENRMSKNDDDNIVIVKHENSKNCPNCHSDFVSNHKKQKYCSDDCRKKFWEAKNGRSLKLRPKKK